MCLSGLAQGRTCLELSLTWRFVVGCGVEMGRDEMGSEVEWLGGVYRIWECYEVLCVHVYLCMQDLRLLQSAAFTCLGV